MTFRLILAVIDLATLITYPILYVIQHARRFLGIKR